MNSIIFTFDKHIDHKNIRCEKIGSGYEVEVPYCELDWDAILQDGGEIRSLPGGGKIISFEGELPDILEPILSLLGNEEAMKVILAHRGLKTSTYSLSEMLS